MHGFQNTDFRSAPGTWLLVAFVLMAFPAHAGDKGEPVPGPQDGSVLAGVTFRVIVPSETPVNDLVYIAGDFQGWNPGDPAFALTEVDAFLHEITLSFDVGTTLQFKFTRGTWGMVEKGPNGEEIPNRIHLVTGHETIDLTVASWADLPANSTITGDVSLITVPGFLNGRRVWIYLPPMYHTEPDKHFPVLYMFDGQNVFDAATSFAGEWEVDETCEILIPAQLMAPIIVVAVANGELDRTHEYTPWFDPDWQGGVGGGGEDHLQEFINVLMPHVNANYRTLTGPQNTGLSGSSLGGLMSLYAAYSHPEVFGRIGAISPYIRWKNRELLTYASGQAKPASQVYMDMGTLEWGVFQDEDGNGIDDSIDDLRAMRDIMLGQGFVLDDDLMVVEDEGGQHHESYWAARFPVTLQFLFPFGLSPAPLFGSPGRLTVTPNIPNPFNPTTSLYFEITKPSAVSLGIYDLGGKLVRELLKSFPHGEGFHTVQWDGRDNLGSQAPSGVYLYRITAGLDQETGKMALVR